MKIFNVFFILIIFCNVNAETDLLEKIKQDDSFIVPGLGANRVLLDEDINYVIQRFKQHGFNISKPKKIAELFKDVFNLSSTTPIYFDTLYHNDENKFSLCVYQNKVVAVIGTNINKITIDFVDLNAGINNFIYHYGNKNLHQMRNGSHGIFYYPEKGIAVVDDNLNDTIDMYIIFMTRGRNRR